MKTCNHCGNPNCPYPTDAEYGQALANRWGRNPANKDCWMPIEGEDDDNETKADNQRSI